MNPDDRFNSLQTNAVPRRTARDKRWPSAQTQTPQRLAAAFELV
jgi:hypothetical protein